MSLSQILLAIWVAWYVPWLAAGVFSARTKVQMGADAASPWRAVASIGMVLLFAATGAGAAGSDGISGFRLAAPIWTAPAPVEWILVALVVAGFAFCWWARRHLGKLWSGFVTLKEDHRIIDTGPYGLVRHPIYTGVMFSAVMTALAEATAPAMLGAVLVSAGFWGVARTEEGFLRAQLGAAGYDDYSRRVPMLLPRLG